MITNYFLYLIRSNNTYWAMFWTWDTVPLSCIQCVHDQSQWTNRILTLFTQMWMVAQQRLCLDWNFHYIQRKYHSLWKTKTDFWKLFQSWNTLHWIAHLDSISGYTDAYTSFAIQNVIILKFYKVIFIINRPLWQTVIHSK